MTHSVSLPHVDEVVADMARFDARIEAQIADLDAQVARLQAQWSGEAADAQADAHAQVVAGLEQMRSGLTHLRAAARAAHENYGAAIAANQRMFGQVG